jgi:hypothetical protein
VTVVEIGFVPSAPLLVPGLAGGSAAADESLRAACREVVASLVRARPATIVVVAETPTAGAWPAAATWDFHGFGVPPRPPADLPCLPWSLGLGAWLLDDAGWDGGRDYVGIAGEDASLPELTGPVAFLAVGDGAVRPGQSGSRSADDRAERFDDSVASWLAAGDAAGLAGLDDALARDLTVSGRLPWRAVASAVAGSAVEAAHLLCRQSPYGVCYLVARWRLTRPGAPAPHPATS